MDACMINKKQIAKFAKKVATQKAHAALVAEQKKEKILNIRVMTAVYFRINGSKKLVKAETKIEPVRVNTIYYCMEGKNVAHIAPGLSEDLSEKLVNGEGVWDVHLHFSSGDAFSFCNIELGDLKKLRQFEVAIGNGLWIDLYTTLI